jgi:hypothetical protein
VIAGLVLLAHQGGWDEMLMVLGPILAIVWLLRLARRRVERNGPPAQPDVPHSGPPPTAPG